MRKFRVNINGKSYEIEIEELGTGLCCDADLSCQSHRERGFMSKVTKQTAQDRSTGAVHEVKAPIPGIIAEISVKEGTSVKAGERLLVLEAMKMENAILSPVSGKIEKILVDQGKPVNGNQLMVMIK